MSLFRDADLSLDPAHVSDISDVVAILSPGRDLHPDLALHLLAGLIDVVAILFPGRDLHPDLGLHPLDDLTDVAAILFPGRDLHPDLGLHPLDGLTDVATTLIPRRVLQDPAPLLLGDPSGVVATLTPNLDLHLGLALQHLDGLSDVVILLPCHGLVLGRVHRRVDGLPVVVAMTLYLVLHQGVDALLTVHLDPVHRHVVACLTLYPDHLKGGAIRSCAYT
jgi:hypothetical protein